MAPVLFLVLNLAAILTMAERKASALAKVTCSKATRRSPLGLRFS